nr:MAG TPA: hypothetical protein [Caudoviricetes sp.]
MTSVLAIFSILDFLYRENLFFTFVFISSYQIQSFTPDFIISKISDFVVLFISKANFFISSQICFFIFSKFKF